jgi:hypothetical protein
VIGAGAGPKIMTFSKLGADFFKLEVNLSSKFISFEDIIIETNLP